jgi:hypothetical protein
MVVAPAAPLPRSMLARGGPLPTRGDWAYAVKWDAFAIGLRSQARFEARRDVSPPYALHAVA